MYVLLHEKKAPRVVTRRGFYRKPMSERADTDDWLLLKRKEAAVERRMEQLRGHEIVLRR